MAVFLIGLTQFGVAIAAPAQTLRIKARAFGMRHKNFRNSHLENLERPSLAGQSTETDSCFRARDHCLANRDEELCTACILSCNISSSATSKLYSGANFKCNKRKFDILENLYTDEDEDQEKKKQSASAPSTAQNND